MAKPIFLIQCPARIITSDQAKTIVNKLEQKLIDWHVLIINSSHVDDFQFSAFSDQASTDIEVEKLKEMLLNQLI